MPLIMLFDSKDSNEILQDCFLAICQAFLATFMAKKWPIKCSFGANRCGKKIRMRAIIFLINAQDAHAYTL